MRNLNVLAITLFILAGIGEIGAQSPDLGDITVVITNLRNTDGEILISLYDKAEGFPRDRDAIIRAAAVAPDASGQVTTIHDEDNSQGMTFGRFHLPKEGYCFSNNVKVRFKPPKFKKTKFTLNGDHVTQALRMRY
jgi:uncharacterized protein (DUF2141 family)